MNDLGSGDDTCGQTGGSEKSPQPGKSGRKQEPRGDKQHNISRQIGDGHKPQIGVGIVADDIKKNGDGLEGLQVQVLPDGLPVGKIRRAGLAEKPQHEDENTVYDKAPAE